MSRPPKYKDGKISEPEYETSHPEKLVALMGEGYLDYEIYAHFGVCKDTFYRWIREHENFQKAYDIGFAQCYAYYLKHARECMAKGDDRGAKYFIMIMNNKFEWAKNPEGTGQVTNISINNMNVLQQKDKAGLIDYIKRIGDKNKDVLDVQFISSEIKNDQSS